METDIFLEANFTIKEMWSFQGILNAIEEQELSLSLHHSQYLESSKTFKTRVHKHLRIHPLTLPPSLR